MKKVRLILLLALISTTVFAQNGNHIKFRDIEVNGTLSQFVSQLGKISYSLVMTEDDASILEGTFLGKKGELFVLSTPKTKTVWKVAFYFQKDESWISLKSDYKSLKEQFIKKYGEPWKSFEFFSKPYYEGDGYETQALQLDKCTFVSYWKTEVGTIKLSIFSSCKILIAYEDKINSEISTKEEDEAIQDEI